MSGRHPSFWSNENRAFGVTMAGALGGVALVRFLWVGAITWWLVGMGIGLLGIGLLAPAWLNQLRIGWLKFAGVLGAINARILLSVVFIGLIIPVAVVLRLLGKRPIHPGGQQGTDSYWRHRRAQEFDAGRMERQF